jgi:hypothetical protein
MSSRYRHITSSGEISTVSSALELAVDQHWYVNRRIYVQALPDNANQALYSYRQPKLN